MDQVKLLAQDSNLNSHQLQLVLAELSNLIRTLQEASAVLLEASTVPTAGRVTADELLVLKASMGLPSLWCLVYRCCCPALMSCSAT